MPLLALLPWSNLKKNQTHIDLSCDDDLCAQRCDPLSQFTISMSLWINSRGCRKKKWFAIFDIQQLTNLLGMLDTYWCVRLFLFDTFQGDLPLGKHKLRSFHSLCRGKHIFWSNGKKLAATKWLTDCPFRYPITSFAAVRNQEWKCSALEVFVRYIQTNPLATSLIHSLSFPIYLFGVPMPFDRTVSLATEFDPNWQHINYIVLCIAIGHMDGIDIQCFFSISLSNFPNAKPMSNPDEMCMSRCEIDPYGYIWYGGREQRSIIPHWPPLDDGWWGALYRLVLIATLAQHFAPLECWLDANYMHVRATLFPPIMCVRLCTGHNRTIFTNIHVCLCMAQSILQRIHRCV